MYSNIRVTEALGDVTIRGDDRVVRGWHTLSHLSNGTEIDNADGPAVGVFTDIFVDHSDLVSYLPN
ncbi:hypothetical protein P3T76_013805 [Phytophthora citrophthora]|uniref:Uncharacterized protein n=1 Tax=Phytophthora citrophthora TaxID=4793 RepID=A0AAD9LBV1_9STRA|nr:hypothetical protein P3T76_013805 [Phytophthora citrophthora]